MAALVHLECAAACARASRPPRACFAQYGSTRDACRQPSACAPTCISAVLAPGPRVSVFHGAYGGTFGMTGPCRGGSCMADPLRTPQHRPRLTPPARLCRERSDGVYLPITYLIAKVPSPHACSLPAPALSAPGLTAFAHQPDLSTLSRQSPPAHTGGVHDWSNDWSGPVSNEATPVHALRHVCVTGAWGSLCCSHNSATPQEAPRGSGMLAARAQCVPVVAPIRGDRGPLRCQFSGERCLHGNSTRSCSASMD